MGVGVGGCQVCVFVCVCACASECVCVCVCVCVRVKKKRMAMRQFAVCLQCVCSVFAVCLQYFAVCCSVLQVYSTLFTRFLSCGHAVCFRCYKMINFDQTINFVLNIHHPFLQVFFLVSFVGVFSRAAI